MSQAYSVYRIRFADTAEYFGCTSQDLASRIYQHTADSHNEGVAERMDAGMDFEVSLMAQGLAKPKALELERGYIRTGSNILNTLGPGIPSRQRRAGSRKEQVSISFPPDDLRRLRKIADREDVSIAHLIRRETNRLLKKESKP